MMYSAIFQAFIIVQLASIAVAQFPMPFPFPGMPQPMPPPMSPSVFPLAPPMIPPQGIHYPLQQKLPVVVMPYYSKNGESKPKSKSNRRNQRRRIRQRLLRDRESSSSVEAESGQSSSHEYEHRLKNKKTRRQVLTPMVSYVTKDGYVVYQKKIKKDKAMDWLEMGKGNKKDSEEEHDSGDLRRLNSVRRKKKYHRHSH